MYNIYEYDAKFVYIDLSFGIDKWHQTLKVYNTYIKHLVKPKLNEMHIIYIIIVVRLLLCCGINLL